MGRTSMWERTEEMVQEQDQAASKWLKFANDGDTAVLVFLDEPYPRQVCFVDGKYMPFSEELQAQGKRPSLRIAYNVALFDTKEVKVLEQGVMFFKQLMQLRKTRPTEDWAFEITRHGAAKDPKTTYQILPQHKLTDEQKAEFQALELHDLAAMYESEEEAEKPPSKPAAKKKSSPSDTPTIPLPEAQGIVRTLKVLPREATDRFLEHFGIRRIRDLPAAKLDEAARFVDVLEADAADTDPYAI